MLKSFVYVWQDRIKDLNNQADQFVEAGVWDSESIISRKKTINERYEKYEFIISL